MRNWSKRAPIPGVWAEEYDRDLSNVFAIAGGSRPVDHRSASSKSISARKKAMNEWPTRDLVAYDLYTRAKIWLYASTLSAATAQNMRQGR